MSRTDSASTIITADAATLYAALTDPYAMAQWRVPNGMRGEVLEADPQAGGRFRMALHYDDPEQKGKTGDGWDVFESRFIELVENERVVEAIEFTSPDPDFSGTMIVVTTLEAAPGGTRVTLTCTDVPSGIGRADHIAGLTSSLNNLAAYSAP
jgi:uncharacterized protein YndB with AHSA1/START domain